MFNIIKNIDMNNFIFNSDISNKSNSSNINYKLNNYDRRDVQQFNGNSSIDNVIVTELSSTNTIQYNESIKYSINSENSSINEENNSSINGEKSNDSEISLDNNIDVTENYENIIYLKYMKNNLLINKKNKDINNDNIECKLTKSVIINNYKELIYLLDNGITIYRSSKNGEFGCCNKRCIKNNCNSTKNICYKNSLYHAINNTNKGIKTIYHLLLKILIINPKLRNLCKCCENIEHKNYLQYLEKNFIDKKQKNNINLDNKIMIELEINYLINKFMSILGLLPCECKFKNKYYKFYKDNYLNFKETIKIYMRTIPQIIKMLKIMFKIKDNNEELHLIKDSRCIHEDIRFYNLSYCKKKKYENLNIVTINEIIMNLDILNNWIIDSIRISIHLYNQQSLEYFRFILIDNKYKQNSRNIPSDINFTESGRFKGQNMLSKIFEKIYSKNNDLLDLTYSSNKKNIISSILEYLESKKLTLNTQNYDNSIIELINIIIKQIYYRNINSIEKYDVNEILLNYIIECLKNNNILLGLEFIKYIKELQFKKEYQEKLEYIFNTILENENILITTKISYLKIINKNKINIIQYDIINKLLDNKYGDKIIIEFNKDENSLFNIINNYKNSNYIKEIIKKCITNKKVDILDYVLYNLDSNIRSFKINLITLYVKNIINNNEYHYIELLKIILKYKHKDIDDNGNNNIILYCIQHNLTLSSILFIKNNFIKNIEINGEINNSLLIKCIEMQNHIIAGYIIDKYPIIINKKFNNQNILNFLFNLYSSEKIINSPDENLAILSKRQMSSNVLMRFIIKIIKPIINNKIKDNIINYQDSKNELIGFKILKSNLKSCDKIILFNILKNIINPMLINNISSNDNFPLILYSVLLNEYEITFMMLNNLFRNNIISKVNKDSTINTIFDYYIDNNSNININFIPIIFKFIKDNHDKDFEENNLLTILEDDIYIIKYILICMQCIIYLLSSNKKTDYYKYIEKDYEKINDVIYDSNSNYVESNKYIELSCNDNIFKKYNNINLTTDNEDEQNINNKKIWLRSDNIINSSEIEGSDIIF